MSINIFYSYDESYKLSLLYHKVYSYWLQFIFKRCSTAFFRTPVYIIGGKYISIGKNFSTGPRLRIEAWYNYKNKFFYNPEIIIGDNVCLNYNCHIGSINKIVIEDNVLIGSNVLITDHTHGDTTKMDISLPPTQRQLFSKGPVIIGKNVLIGENVSILPGVTIGENSIIGANSVVTKAIPANVVASGNPATIKKKINPGMLY